MGFCQSPETGLKVGKTRGFGAKVGQNAPKPTLNPLEPISGDWQTSMFNALRGVEIVRKGPEAVLAQHNSRERKRWPKNRKAEQSPSFELFLSIFSGPSLP